MKEHYETLSEFIGDILKAAEVASQETNDIVKNEKPKESNNECAERITKQYPFSKITSDVTKNTNNKSACLKELPRTVDIVDDNCYLLTNMLKGNVLPQHQELIFEHTTDDGYSVPGITVAQLLTVLYNKFKIANDLKKLDLVKELMN